MGSFLLFLAVRLRSSGGVEPTDSLRVVVVRLLIRLLIDRFKVARVFSARVSPLADGPLLRGSCCVLLLLLLWRRRSNDRHGLRAQVESTVSSIA